MFILTCTQKYIYTVAGLVHTSLQTCAFPHMMLGNLPCSLMRDALCAAAALLHSQRLCNMDTAAPGCGAREESCRTGLTALPDEIKWPFFRLLPLRGSSCRMSVETWQLFPQQERKKEKEGT